MKRLALLLLLLLPIGLVHADGGMGPGPGITSLVVAPTLVQSSSVGQRTGFGNTVTLTLNSVVSGHDIAVLDNYTDYGSSSNATDTCNDGSAYTSEVSHLYNAQRLTQILRLRNVSSGTHTIVCTGGGTAGNSFGQAMAVEIGGDANLAVDGTAVNDASSVTPSVGPTGTLAVSGEIVLVALGGDGNNSWAGITSPPTTGYTSLYLDTAASIMQSSFAYQQVYSTSAVSAAWGTLTTGSPWGGVIATFRSH